MKLSCWMVMSNCCLIVCQILLSLHNCLFPLYWLDNTTSNLWGRWGWFSLLFFMKLEVCNLWWFLYCTIQLWIELQFGSCQLKFEVETRLYFYYLNIGLSTTDFERIHPRFPWAPFASQAIWWAGASAHLMSTGMSSSSTGWRLDKLANLFNIF